MKEQEQRAKLGENVPTTETLEVSHSSTLKGELDSLATEYFTITAQTLARSLANFYRQ